MKEQGWHYGIKNKEIGEEIIKGTFLRSNKRWMFIFIFVEMIVSILSFGMWLLGEEMVCVFVCFISLLGTLLCGFGYKLMKKRIQQCETGELYVKTCVCERILKFSQGKIGTYNYYKLMVNIGGEYQTIHCQQGWFSPEIKEGEEVTLVMYSLNFKHQIAFVPEKVYKEYR